MDKKKKNNKVRSNFGVYIIEGSALESSLATEYFNFHKKNNETI